MKFLFLYLFQDHDFNNRSVANIPNKIAVCVKPLHFNYDQVSYRCLDVSLIIE